ncbi:MAG: hypothetical protein ACFFGZ_02115 [Candidatus Thorarchaeota archaeon]
MSDIPRLARLAGEMAVSNLQESKKTTSTRELLRPEGWSFLRVRITPYCGGTLVLQLAVPTSWPFLTAGRDIPVSQKILVHQSPPSPGETPARIAGPHGVQQ